jgi:hypothetical protein
MNVQVDPLFITATVQANLGYQGESQFHVSLDSGIITAYSAEC